MTDEMLRMVEAAAADWDSGCVTGLEVVRRPDVLITTREYPFQWGSGVRYARWTGQECERRIDEVLAFFAERRRRFMWLIGPSTTPADLAERLIARGFRQQRDSAGMSADLPLEGIRGRAVAAVKVVEVTNERTALDSTRVSMPDATPEQTSYIARERAQLTKCKGRRSGFVVAYAGDVAVSTARWLDARDGSWVYLGGGMTLPEHRGRGYYTAVTAYRIDRAMSRGIRHACVLADRTTSAPILARRGFRDHGTLRFLESP